VSDEFYVVRNHEEQYSIWRLDKPVPAGWVTVGDPASREECLATIDEIWTDMRPLSLRASMAAASLDESA
jgi:MbtH protein